MGKSAYAMGEGWQQAFMCVRRGGQIFAIVVRMYLLNDP